MMAAFGLRPHELFHVDEQKLQQTGIAYVKDGKTGARLVFPYYPEWVEDFNLKTIQVPQVSGKCNTDLGARVTRAFCRLKIPFPAYSLRHCWAIRLLYFGLDLSSASQQMGHSLAVHTSLYLRWITEEHQRKLFETLLNNPDRPQPPGIRDVKDRVGGNEQF
jgi:integrase